MKCGCWIDWWSNGQQTASPWRIVITQQHRGGGSKTLPQEFGHSLTPRGGHQLWALESATRWSLALEGKKEEKREAGLPTIRATASSRSLCTSLLACSLPHLTIHPSLPASQATAYGRRDLGTKVETKPGPRAPGHLPGL